MGRIKSKAPSKYIGLYSPYDNEEIARLKDTPKFYVLKFKNGTIVAVPKNGSKLIPLGISKRSNSLDRTLNKHGYYDCV